MHLNIYFNFKFDCFRKVGILVSHFRADWAPQCKQISDVILELANQPETKVSQHLASFKFKG